MSNIDQSQNYPKWFPIAGYSILGVIICSIIIFIFFRGALFGADKLEKTPVAVEEATAVSATSPEAEEEPPTQTPVVVTATPEDSPTGAPDEPLSPTITPTPAVTCSNSFVLEQKSEIEWREGIDANAYSETVLIDGSTNVSFDVAVRNLGCTWTEAYTAVINLQLINPDNANCTSNQFEINLSTEVPRLEVYDVSIPVIFDDLCQVGDFQGTFYMQDASKERFNERDGNQIFDFMASSGGINGRLWEDFLDCNGNPTPNEEDCQNSNSGDQQFNTPFETPLENLTITLAQNIPQDECERWGKSNGGYTLEPENYVASTITNNQGEYAFYGLAPSEYCVFIYTDNNKNEALNEIELGNIKPSSSGGQFITVGFNREVVDFRIVR